MQLSNSIMVPKRIATRLVPLLLFLGTALFFAYLLRRFPYDGLYGVDSYAYFYQARALWEESSGAPLRSFELFTSDGLQHWPVGYHLHIILGTLLMGAGALGPQMITASLAALCPMIAYFIVLSLLERRHGTTSLLAVLAGITAGILLPLNGTFTRTGLSLMSDVPTVFWGLLFILCFLRADGDSREPDEEVDAPSSGFRRSLLFAAGGLALGMAVLIRYSSVLFAVPVLVYFLVSDPGDGRPKNPLVHIARNLPTALWAIPLFLLALTPQLLYLLSHNPGTEAANFLSSFNFGGLFSTTTHGADGTSTFAYPMIVFYLLGPIWQTQDGFYSLFFIPAAALGALHLLASRRYKALAFLLSWWLLIAIVYASTPYQTHRYALTYLPAVAILIGCGTGVASSWLIDWLSRLSPNVTAPTMKSTLVPVTGVVTLLCFAAGTWQCWDSVRDWVATHSAWRRDEQNMARFIVDIAKKESTAGTPHVITLGYSAPLYNTTEWPVMELYFADPERVGAFLDGHADGTKLAVIPMETLETRWVGTPTGEHWRWIESEYTLQELGQVNTYTIFALHKKQVGP